MKEKSEWQLFTNEVYDTFEPDQPDLATWAKRNQRILSKIWKRCDSNNRLAIDVMKSFFATMNRLRYEVKYYEACFRNIDIHIDKVNKLFEEREIRNEKREHKVSKKNILNDAFEGVLKSI